MRPRSSILSLVCSILFANQAWGALIDFGNNPIHSDPDFVAIAAGGGTVAVNSGPTFTKLVDGFSVHDVSYTVTPTFLGPVVVSWIGGLGVTRDFTLSQDSDLLVTISGETDLRPTGGQVDTFDVEGVLYPGFTTVLYEATSVPPGPISWNMTSSLVPTTAGARTLGELSVVEWTPSSLDDRLTISSTYVVRVTAVPEPASFVLCGLGAIGLFSYGRMRRKN